MLLIFIEKYFIHVVKQQDKNKTYLYKEMKIDFFKKMYIEYLSMKFGYYPFLQLLSFLSKFTFRILYIFAFDIPNILIYMM